MHFSLTWDYRCPFARNMHEHVVSALDAGAPWDVEFLPFSLLEVHVEEGEPSILRDPTRRNDVAALAVGVVVRDSYPEAVRRAHLALFAARHDEARDLSDLAVLADVLDAVGLPATAVLEEALSDDVADRVWEAHHRAAERHHVFGVPTIILDDGRAAFVRLMTRPRGDAVVARRTIDHLLTTLVEHPELNELKFTTIPR